MLLRIQRSFKNLINLRRAYMHGADDLDEGVTADQLLS
jgi:hypothetical protein